MKQINMLSKADMVKGQGVYFQPMTNRWNWSGKLWKKEL